MSHAVMTAFYDPHPTTVGPNLGQWMAAEEVHVGTTERENQKGIRMEE